MEQRFKGRYFKVNETGQIGKCISVKNDALLTLLIDGQKMVFFDEVLTPVDSGIVCKTTEYSGYSIQQRIDEKSHCATILKNGEIVKMIAGDIEADGSHNALEKSKQYIDSLGRPHAGLSLSNLINAK